MKVLLINPCLPVYQRIPSVPLGLLSIASYLNANGHKALICERSVDKGSYKKYINEFSPDVIGISAMSFLSSNDAKRVTESLRKITKVPIVWGGQAASAMPELIMSEVSPDYIIDGEGEITWKELADALEASADIQGINGLIYKDSDGNIVKNPIRPVADLAQFPDIDWTLIEPEKYFSSFFNCSRMLYLYASKGCPAQCTFCSNRHFHQGKNRCRKPEQVMRDIKYLAEKHGMNGIYFSDELWCPNREIRNELCNMLIEANLDVVWGCQMRLGVLNEEDIKLMSKAGCRWILFGIESGNADRIKTIKKSIDLSIAKETIKWCENSGITVQASFIIGFPDEDEDEIRSTIKFADNLDSSLVAMNILIPLPNSEILAYAESEGKFQYPCTIKAISRVIEQNAGENVVVNLSKVPDKDLKVVHYSYQWRAFSSKDSVNNEKFGVIKKMAKDTFDRIFRHGLKGFFFGTVISVKQFITVFFYSHFFIKTQKKYGLR